MPVPPRLALIILLAFPLPLVLAASVVAPIWRRTHVPSQGFFNPQDNNGSMLTVRLLLTRKDIVVDRRPVQFGFSTSPPDLGEPLNMIISANSDPAVLQDQDTNGGLRNFFL